MCKDLKMGIPRTLTVPVEEFVAGCGKGRSFKYTFTSKHPYFSRLLTFLKLSLLFFVAAFFCAACTVGGNGNTLKSKKKKKKCMLSVKFKGDLAGKLYADLPVRTVLS